MEVRSFFCVLLSCDIYCIFAHKNAQTDNQTKNKVKNMQKNRKVFLDLSVFITGDERIELPLKVLETSVIPFDQSPVLCP
jgi:hypothetical protein